MDYGLQQGCPTFLTGGPSVQILNSRGPDRDAEGIEGKGMGMGTRQVRGLGSIISSPSGVRGGAPAGKKLVLTYIRA